MDPTEDRAGYVQMPIEGTLDLHTFRPADVKELVIDYLAECRSRGILEVRIIHGKGTGALRSTVHAVLDRIPEVVAYSTADGSGGGWGATIVTLAPDGDDSAGN
ncbi:MAG: Smr/MutS family protein [Candidatus Eisenbacteria bacterium]|nr:Smr/MutS family protein [Candidatus Eisenbacteria bacterium]